MLTVTTAPRAGMLGVERRSYTLCLVLPAPAAGVGFLRMVG